MPHNGDAIWEKPDLLSKKNALHYTQSTNEIFRKYASYRSRVIAKKSDFLY